MLLRIAACAAWLFAWSICPGVDRGLLPYPGITVAMAQAQKTAQHQPNPGWNQNVDAEGRREIAARPKGSDPRAANISPQIALATASQPFGLAAEQVFAGEILRKWAGVQSEIRQNKEILARCREGGACPDAARRFLAIIDKGRARSGRARIGVINREINLAIMPTADLDQTAGARHSKRSRPAAATARITPSPSTWR